MWAVRVQPDTRRERRLRSWWRHEAQSVAAALATAQHHSYERKKAVEHEGREVLEEMPESLVLACGRDAAGITWCQVARRQGAEWRVYWWRASSSHVQWTTPAGFTASPGRLRSTGQGRGGFAVAFGCGRPCEHQRQVPAVQGVRPVGAQIQFISTVWDIPVVEQRQVRTVWREIRQVQFLG